MKLNAYATHKMAITNFQAGELTVNKQHFTQSVLIRPNGEITPWDCKKFSDITEAQLHALVQTPAHIWLIGVGSEHHVLPPTWLLPFYRNGIGIEYMTSASAARTFNYLVTEERSVALAIIV